MSELTIQQITDTVCNIEQDIFEQTDAEYLNITVTSNGFVHLVDFLGIQIWNSDDDMRKYINAFGEEEVQESIEEYLRKVITTELEKIKMIELL